jgi:WD40 repeat protein
MHRDMPLAVALSTNGQFLVTGRLDRTADVWSLTDRTIRFTLRGHEAEIAAVAVSPDGQRVVTGSHDHTAKVWDASRSRE